MKRVRATFLFTCCLLLAIGPLNLMQLIAWGNMLHDYSGEKTVAEAADMTFNGEYPCEMCRRIAETKALAARARDSQPDSPAPLPREERHSLRLIFQCDDRAPAPALRWLVRSTVIPGELDFPAPLPCSTRVPTPPPQLSSC